MHKCYLSLSPGAPPFVVAGTGRPLRQFVYSRDLARLMVWAVREYVDVEPIILSREFPRRNVRVWGRGRLTPLYSV